MVLGIFQPELVPNEAQTPENVESGEFVLTIVYATHTNHLKGKAVDAFVKQRFSTLLSKVGGVTN